MHEYLSRVIPVPLVILRVVRPAEAGAKTEIRELDVAVAVDEDVVRLDVPMNEAHFVHAFHSANQLRYVKPAR